MTKANSHSIMNPVATAPVLYFSTHSVDAIQRASMLHFELESTSDKCDMENVY